MLLRSILVEREPIYRQHEVVHGFAPNAFGLEPEEVDALGDDLIGRGLDRLFLCDRGSLLTALVTNAIRVFGISLKELHNDSTTIRFCGQHHSSRRGRWVRGQRAPWITYGYSKDHRPDLKQLLYGMTTTLDGGVPVQFRCDDGNTNDTTTHWGTWTALRDLHGGPDFLYVADSKLCTMENMEAIHNAKGRFVTVLPRSRREDAQFREWIQSNEPTWEVVWDRPNPRRRYGPRDVWMVHRPLIPSREGWPVTWVFSTLLRLHQEHRRQENILRATQEIKALQAQLAGPRPRLRSQFLIEERLKEIVSRLRVSDYIRAWVYEKKESRFLQERPGRPGPETRYRRKVRKRLGVAYDINDEAIQYDQKSDGMYPLLSNDRSLTAAQVLEAHKRQPKIEGRFKDLKSVFEIAPVFLKNEGRIQALFLLYFMALLVEAVIERELRRSMTAHKIEELPLYPEARMCKRPTARRVFDLFSSAQRHVLTKGTETVQLFPPELTDLQAQILELLDAPKSLYTAPS